MKAKKAVKRLTRVEALLSNVIDGFAAGERAVKELLGNAKAAVVRARKTVNVKTAAPAAEKKPPVKARSAKSRISPEGRKKLSLAAKKRWAVAKRNHQKTPLDGPKIAVSGRQDVIDVRATHEGRASVGSERRSTTPTTVSACPSSSVGS
jgi:hypothetical protein